MPDAQHSLQYNRELYEFRRLPRFNQPSGLRMCATLAAEVPLFTRPTYSSMIFGLFPAASIRVGCAIRVGIEKL
jgi:hypothetical protein